MSGFWRWYDRGSRIDFAGTLLGIVFDWKGWLLATLPAGGFSMTFLWAAIVNRDALDVWVSAVVVAAALLVAILVLIKLAEKYRTRRATAASLAATQIRPETTAFELTDSASGNLIHNVTATSDPKLADAGAIALAGTVRAILERAMGSGFKLPLPTGDMFLTWYEELRNSAHPIWIDTQTNQLRRDFLQYSAILGQERGSIDEWHADRKQLQSFGSRLIAKLTGAPDFAIANPALKGQISFNYSLNGGVITIGPVGKNFRLRFSRASNTSIHMYRDSFSYLARVRGKVTGDRLELSAFQSVDSITIQVGEHFLAMNNFGQTIQGRILVIKDNMRNDDIDEVCFDYEIAPVRGGTFLAL